MTRPNHPTATKLVAQIDFSVPARGEVTAVMVLEERCVLRQLEVVGGELLAITSFRVGTQAMFTTGAPVPAAAMGSGLFEMGCGPGTHVSVTLQSYADGPVSGLMRLHSHA